jgi:hypothetical protein
MDPKENMANCLETLLNFDRYDWDNFHDDFVRTLVQFGYRKDLTDGEEEWYKNVVEKDITCISIVDYTLPD